MGAPIGERLLRSSEARLQVPLTSPSPTLERLQKLLDRCASKDGRLRPSMRGVTNEVEALMNVGRATASSTSAESSTGRTESEPISAIAAEDCDRAVLMSMLEEWEDLRKHRGDSWSFVDMNFWSGVSCNQAGQVKEFQLSNMSMKGGVEK